MRRYHPFWVTRTGAFELVALRIVSRRPPPALVLAHLVAAGDHVGQHVQQWIRTTARIQPGEPIAEHLERVAASVPSGARTVANLHDILETVGPLGTVAHPIDGIGLDHRAAVDLVLAQPSADLDDRRALAVGADLELLARREDSPSPTSGGDGLAAGLRGAGRLAG